MSRDGGVRQLLRDHLPTWHWTTVETGGTGRGVPDAEYCAPGPPGTEGTCGWVEGKLTETTKVELRPEQVAWLLRRARVGGRVTVAVRQRYSAGPRRGPARDALWLLDGGQAPAIKVGGLSVDAPYYLGHWDLKARDRARWDAVGAVLVRPLYVST